MTRQLSSLAACARIARLTSTRLWRSKVKWISMSVALIPVLMVLLLAPGDPDQGTWLELFEVLAVLLVVIPALHLAPWLAEELEDRTYTYLWARPMPRWALLFGKFLALVPFVAAVCALAMTGSYLAMFGGAAGDQIGMLGGSLVALTLGIVACSSTAIGIGGVVPRFATATVIVYFMFLDSALGGMPFSVQNLSISFHVREVQQALVNDSGDLTTSTLWMFGLSLVWLTVAVWRVTRAEYKGGSS